MFYKKNLKAVLSVIIFVFAVCTFTMLQGFELKDRVHTLTAIVAGENSQTCIVTATQVESPYTGVTLYYSSANKAYHFDGPLVPGDYRVKACAMNSQQGDGSSIIIKVKKIGPGDDNLAMVPPPVQAWHCLD